jgi:flagellar basal-body rod protein FlgB
MPGAASPNGNSVSLEAEMVKAVDVKQQHDMALSIYRSVSEIIRASLGRR